MTVTYREEKINGYVISIEQDKFTPTYRVVACPMIDECRASYPETSIPYSTWREAQQRFGYLKRKIKRDGYACSR